MDALCATPAGERTRAGAHPGRTDQSGASQVHIFNCNEKFRKSSELLNHKFMRKPSLVNDTYRDKIFV